MSEFGNEKGIQGFTRKEFAAADPVKVFGSDVRVEDLPEGIRLYLRGKAVDLNTRQLVVRVYRLEDDGGSKTKRVSVGRFINKIPEDEDLGEQFGPSEDGSDASYIWIAKWRTATGEETGMMTEPVIIGKEWARAHAAWIAKQSARAPATDSAPAVTPSAAPTPSNALDITGILKIMQATEEKTLATFERIAAITARREPENPSEILKDAYKGAADMFQQSVKASLDLSKDVAKQTRDAVDKIRAENDDQDAGAAEEAAEGAAAGASPIPDWLLPYMGQVKPWLEKLLAGGPVGAAVKTLILSRDDWKEIFKDKEKWGMAVSAMEMEFGTEQTKKALDILLNRRAEKAAAAPGNKKKSKK